MVVVNVDRFRSARSSCNEVSVFTVVTTLGVGAGVGAAAAFFSVALAGFACLRTVTCCTAAAFAFFEGEVPGLVAAAVVVVTTATVDTETAGGAGDEVDAGGALTGVHEAAVAGAPGASAVCGVRVEASSERDGGGGGVAAAGSAATFPAFPV